MSNYLIFYCLIPKIIFSVVELRQNHNSGATVFLLIHVHVIIIGASATLLSCVSLYLKDLIIGTKVLHRNFVKLLFQVSL